MKYAIVSDIHGNLEALQIALADIEMQGCREIACLGDIVGYGPKSKECVDVVRRLGMHCVKGNVDDYCSSDMPLDNFSGRLVESVKSVREELSEEDKAWLQLLPHARVLSGFVIVHATLDKPEMWQYVFDKLAAASHFVHQTTAVCFFGHTHVPVAFVREPALVRGGTYSKLKVEKGRSYFVNVGSVGQPRDGTRQGSYACYDLDAELIELRRFDLPDRGGNSGDVGIPMVSPPGSNPPRLGCANE